MVKLNITLEDAYNGRRKEVEYDKKIICPKCKGTWSSNSNEKITCVKCNGSGNELIIGNLSKKCDECNGERKIFKGKCEECKGKMVQTIKRKIGIDLERGVPDGHKYKMANVGDEFPGIETGDLIIEIFLQEHKDFIRKGADLWYKCRILLYEALIGVKSAINHLNGKRILIQTKPDEIIQPETIKTVKGFGMPFFNSPDKYGNLYVEFKIVFPDKLNKEQYKKLSEIFKDEKINIVDDLSKDMETCNLEDYILINFLFLLKRYFLLSINFIF